MDASKLKIRDDLILSRQEHRGTTYFVVKDPLTRRFFRFKEPEHFLIRLLDGEHSPEEIREKFEQEYGDDQLPDNALRSFVDQLGRLGLLEGEEQAGKAPARKSPLYLRFKLINPDRLLTWLEPLTRPFFTRPFLWFSVGLIGVGVGLTMVNSWEIALELPRLLRVSSLLLIWLTILGVTWVHEFAHGLTCKRYGGEVPEMGFMLLFFMPAFYCNVSDTWLFPEKRKKLAVTFAGAYSEMVLWAAAAVVWRLTDASTAPHYLALVVMATSGAHIFFNFNPLIKLDGYYLLSDYLEVPNLRAKALGYLKALASGNFQVRKGLSRRERRIYLIYGALAGTYSFLILLFIAIWAGGFLIGRFQGLGLVLFLALLTMLFWSSLTRLTRREPKLAPEGTEARRGPRRLITVGLPMAAIGIVLFFMPWELKISSPFQVAPRENADVRAEVEGILQEVYVKEGDRVEEGDPLALLSAREYVDEIEKAKKRMAETEARLRLLRSGPRPEEVKVTRQEVDTAQTDYFSRKREFEEGEHMRTRRLKKARVSLAKAATRRRFANELYSLQEKLFKEGLVSKKDSLEAQETLQLREKEMEEAQEDIELIASDQLMTLRTALALAQKRLKEADRRLELLLAGSRKEEIEVVEAELARLRVELAHYETKKSLTRIVSPSGGVVTTPKLKEKVGELVKKGDLILEVHDFSSVIAEIEVPEKEIADIAVGQPVVLKARSYPGRTFYGRVTDIAPIATEGEIQKVVTVRSEIANPDLLLRPGMSGNAKIVAGERRLGEILTRRIARTVRVELWSWY
ncbi:MAG: efflux RND transporter periplasmic adaptor subunit [bacterium]|nr:efflux RND transporter periplasmic adaptor subunit [bacterium]